MIIKRKTVFLTVYFMSMLCLFFSISDLCPTQGLFARAKFVLIAFCLWDLIMHRFTVRHINKVVLFVFLTYLCFCILYGKIWVTVKVAAETNYQFKTTVLMLLMIFLVYYEVEYYNCFELFIHVSFAVIAVFLLFSYIKYFSESSFNPLYVIKFLFNDEARGRARFGLDHWNYVGFYVYVGMILSVFCFKYAAMLGRFTIIYRWALIFVDCIMYLMLISSSSRGGLVSGCLFLGLYILFEFATKIRPDYRLAMGLVFLIGTALFVIVGINEGVFVKIWENSSRGLNISINMPIFHKYGDFWRGMGWVENGALQDANDAFGLGTSSLDMFYVYVYFTTGFIGCVFMGIVYGTIGICNFINYKRKDGWFYIALFLSILFYLYWETILFTIKLWPSLILVVILLHGMGKRGREKVVTENIVIN